MVLPYGGATFLAIGADYRLFTPCHALLDALGLWAPETPASSSDMIGRMCRHSSLPSVERYETGV